jgi:hypothetical protein
MERTAPRFSPGLTIRFKSRASVGYHARLALPKNGPKSVGHPNRYFSCWQFAGVVEEGLG